MYSHVHQDAFQVLRDIQFQQPILLNFIVGSVTTYQGKPPNFNVVYLDPETMLPLDYEIHVFDLEYANLEDKPLWKLKYDYRPLFDMKDLSPESMF